MQRLSLYPWQESQWQSLTQSFTPSARGLLLIGDIGSGIETLSSCYLANILCLDASSERACGQCKSCTLYAAKTHPDHLTIQPPSDGKQISVTKIRELITFCQQSKQTSQYKTVLILEADMMNNASQNALLKTLEEPQENTLIVLTTSMPAKLLPTIRSRCLITHIAKPDDACNAWLQQETGRNQEEVDTLLKLSGGQPLKALTYADELLWEQRKTFYQSLIELVHGDCPVKKAATWDKYDLREVRTWLNLWLYDCLRLKLSSESSQVLNTDFKEQLLSFSQSVPADALYQFYDASLQHFREAEKVPVNTILLLEAIAIAWKKLSKHVQTRNV